MTLDLAATQGVIAVTSPLDREAPDVALSESGVAVYYLGVTAVDEGIPHNTASTNVSATTYTVHLRTHVS